MTNKQVLRVSIAVACVLLLLLIAGSIVFVSNQRSDAPDVSLEVKQEDIVEEETQTTEVDEDVLIATQTSEMALASDKTTHANGYITWKGTNGKTHPLRNALVKLFDRNAAIVGDECIGTCNTDNDGYYHIAFNNNTSIFDGGGSDLYIMVHATGGGNSVKSILGGVYTLGSRDDFLPDVETGSWNSINMEITMDSNAGKAFQIHQGLLCASEFVQTKLGISHSVEANFPTSQDTSYYDDVLEDIYYTASAFENWDTIMHEYGHFIQDIINTNKSPGGSHRFDENLIGKYQEEYNRTLTKDQAIKLAWNEAWATTFAIIAQKENSGAVSNVSGFGDTKYKSDNLEYLSGSTYMGEACEGAIAAVLWDLYDSNNEDVDDITLTVNEWWNITTSGKPTTFNDFYADFCDEYDDEMISYLGANLAKYKMCASDFKFKYDSALAEPPSISWSNNSGASSCPFDNMYIIANNPSNTVQKVLYIGLDSSVNGFSIDSEAWTDILNWGGLYIEIKMAVWQTSDPMTGPYYSETFKIDIPKYRMTKLDSQHCTIIGTGAPISGSISIPSQLFGYTVTSIADHAFDGKTEITSVTIPDTVTSVGAYAFNNCPITSLTFDTRNVTSIGSHAFYGNQLSNIYLDKDINSIGSGAFYSTKTSLVIYVDGTFNEGWAGDWNAANSACLYGCTFDYSGSQAYLISFVKDYNNPMNAPGGGIHNPIRPGSFSFDGLYTDSSYSSSCYSFNPDATYPISSLENGTTVYVKWRSTASTPSPSCVTEGTLVTLADGTQVAVEDLTGEEELLVWDMINGTYSSAPILFVDSEEETTYDVITLTFSDGTQVEVIDEHAFFDLTLNEYVFLRSDAAQYIGHSFHKQADNATWAAVQLVDVTISQKVTTAWSPVTYGHLCLYVNGMLSMPGNTEGFINIFAVDNMKIDEDQMAADIATYGLYTYEEFCEDVLAIPEVVFDAFNGQFLKVSMGKGLITKADIISLFDRYGAFFAEEAIETPVEETIEETVEEPTACEVVAQTICSIINFIISLFR